jgi:hypothetical protein
LYVANESEDSINDDGGDADVPEVIETVLEELFQGLQDKVNSRGRTLKGY